MKKRCLSFVVVLLVVLSVVVLTACGKDGGKFEYWIVYEEGLDSTEYTVGDVFDEMTVNIRAKTPSGTEMTVTTGNLVFSEEDMAKLPLNEDNEFEEDGVFTIRIWLVEENETRPEFFIATWKISVAAKK